MLISTHGSIFRLLQWQWKIIVLSLVVSTAITIGHETLAQTWIALPTLPLTVVGASLGIFVSFRTNSCYDRWWEARKLWGRLINTSRHLAIQILNYSPDEKRETANRLVRRQIAYVHALRTILRDQVTHEDEDFGKYVSHEDAKLVEDSSNITARLLDLHFKDIIELRKSGDIDEFRLASLDESIRHLFDIQGGCERIKKTPLPRSYGFISERMIQWFSALLPAGLVSDLGWGTIPISVLVTLSFKLISETGRVLENPFNKYWNALPLSSMSRTIEINLLELSGEKNLPEPVQPNPPGVLM